MTKDLEDKGYQPTRIWGQWQLQALALATAMSAGPLNCRGWRGKALQRSSIAPSNKQEHILWVHSSDQETTKHTCGEARSCSISVLPWPTIMMCPPPNTTPAIAVERTTRVCGGLRPRLAVSLHCPCHCTTRLIEMFNPSWAVHLVPLSYCPTHPP